MKSSILLLAIVSLTLHSCKPRGIEVAQNTNAMLYFEIPVTDMDRATKFYQSVFGFTFDIDTIHNNTFAFINVANSPQINGALAQGEIYVPTHNGVLVYFYTDDIKNTLAKALTNGGKELFPITPSANNSLVAEFEDCEGNRIALLQPELVI